MKSERELVEQAMRERFTHGNEDNGEAAAWPPAAQRIRAARLRVGLSVDEVAHRLNITTNSYFDLEAYDDEVFTVISLEELGVLCRTLKVQPLSLLLGEEGEGITESVTFEQISSKVRQRITEEGTTAEQWGDAVGWEIEPILHDPAALAQFNVEGLFDICTTVGLDWAAAVPILGESRDRR